MDVTVDVRVDVRMDGRNIKPAGKCGARKYPKKLGKVQFPSFRRLGAPTRAKYVRRRLSPGLAQLEEGGRRPPSVFFFF